MGDDGEDQLLMHVPLDALYIQYNLEEWLDGRKSYTLGAARLALNERLQAKTLASHVVTLIREGEELGFDLAGGWARMAC